ncbi:MAG: oligosaccharide flippase family protein, partial [Terriglobales bacterium]
MATAGQPRHRHPSTVAGAEHAPNLRRGASSLAAARIIRYLFRVVVLLLVARIGGPEILGAYALLVMITETAFLFSGGGFGDFLAREVARDPRVGRSLGWQLTKLRFAYLVIGVASTVSLLLLLRYPESLWTAGLLLGCALFPRAAIESCQGILRGTEHFAPIARTEAIMGTVLVATAFGLIEAGYGLRGIVLGELAAALAGMLDAVRAAARHAPAGPKHLSVDRKLMSATFAFNLYPLIVSVYDRVDVLLLSKLAGNIAVGIYSIPYRAYSALQILPYALFGVWFPNFSREWNSASQRRCSEIMTLLYAFALFAILAVTFFATPTVAWALGGRYAGSALAIKILIWATLPMFLNFALNAVLLATNHERIFIWTAIVCTVTNGALNLIF